MKTSNRLKQVQCSIRHVRLLVLSMSKRLWIKVCACRTEAIHTLCVTFWNRWYEVETVRRRTNRYASISRTIRIIVKVGGT